MIRSAKGVRRLLSVLFVGLAGVLVSGQSLIQFPINVRPIVCPSTECRDLLNVSARMVSGGAGDQYDPHISGKLISFTNDQRTDYYDLSLGGGTIEAPSGATDLLSDVSGQYIMFSRIEATGRVPIELFDTTINDYRELNVTPSPIRIGSGLGATTAAYIDQLAGPGGDLFVTDFGFDPEVTTRLTNDARADQAPQVSPDGRRVVWETCSSTCDIALATRDAVGVWTTSLLTDDAVPQANPDVDGTWVVYDEVTGSTSPDRNIHIRGLNGYVDERLVMPGAQINPAVSRGLVVFESYPDGLNEADLFVYEIATRRLWQLTNTQGISESLSDISVQDDGTVGVAYSWGASPDRDVLAITFKVPGTQTSQQLLRRINNLLDTYNLAVILYLRPALQDAQQALVAGDAAAACAAMSTFTSRVIALESARRLSPRQAQYLLAPATEIQQILGCP